MLSITLEALDDGMVVLVPLVLVPLALEFSQKRRTFGHCFLLSNATLAAHRAFGRRIFHLLKATARAFHTDLSRRRIGHCFLSEDPSLC